MPGDAMASGHLAGASSGHFAGGPRRVPQSGKQKKVALRERRERGRQAEADDAAAEAVEVAKEELQDDRVLRCRLAIARGRKHCQVRLVMRVTAPRAPEAPIPQRRRNATERKIVERAALAARVQAELSASCTEKQPAEATRLWLRAVVALAELLRAEADRLAAPPAAASTVAAVAITAPTAAATTVPAISSPASTATTAAASAVSAPRLFALAQQALQSGPLSGSQPARFKRLARDGVRRPSPVVCACEQMLDALAALALSGATASDEVGGQAVSGGPTGTGAPAGGGAEADAGGGATAAARRGRNRLLSEKQLEAVGAWTRTFEASFARPV